MPVITDISDFKGNVVRIDLDDREPLFIYREVAYSYNLQKGMSLPDAAIEQIRNDHDYKKARERALYLMDYSDNTYMTLFKKLRKNYNEDICYRVCDDLAEVGIINDKRFAENYARKLIEVKLLGRYRAVQEMRDKGIPKNAMIEALRPYEDTERERLKELIEKKYLKKLDYEDHNRKLTAALVRKGYRFDDIKAVLLEIREEYEQEDL
ncbi:MAG: RecX family transcriptional regulator [Ruminococcus sp.]|nr:RecX family transcriptional regulator [Ruminococcus sp.]